jgi:hypothetical protein
MNGFYLLQTCKSQNTIIFNAFGNDQNINTDFLMPLRSVAGINKTRKAYYGDTAFTYPNDTNLEGTGALQLLLEFQTLIFIAMQLYY